MKRFLLKMGMTPEEIERTRIERLGFSKYAQKLGHCETVSDGQILSLGAKAELTVIHTPGHTAGSICLYDELNRTLFSGDTLMMMQVPNVIFEPLLFEKTGYRNLAGYVSSLKKIGRLKINRIYPGHGEPFDNPSEAIHNALSHFKALCEEVLAVLGHKEMNPAEIARTISPHVKGQFLFLKISDVFGALQVLEQNGLVALSRGDPMVFKKKLLESRTNAEKQGA